MSVWRRIWILIRLLLSILAGIVGYLIGCIGAMCFIGGVAGVYLGHGVKAYWVLLAGTVLLSMSCAWEFYFDQTWALLRRLCAKSKTPKGPTSSGTA